MSRSAVWSFLVGVTAATGLGAMAPAQQPEPAPAERPAPATAAELIEQLGDPAYKVRREAEQALRELGEGARPALETAAEKHDDAEVRWRAQRLLRQLTESAATGQLRLRERDDNTSRSWAGPTRPRDLDQMFEDLFQRLETDFQVDIPRRSFFADDFFQDLDEQMRALRGGIPDLDDFGRGVQGRSLQMQMGPQGIELRLEERDENGELQTKVFEAPDLDTFRQKYPEVAKRYLNGDRGQSGLRPLAPPAAIHLMPPFARGPQGGIPRSVMPTPVPLPADGPRLGVYVQELSPDVRDYLGIDHGLLVESVEPGSLADRLGIEARDIVLEVEGQPIDSPQAVRRALEGADDKVDVRVNRRGENVELSVEESRQDRQDSDKLKPRKAGE